MRTPQPRACLLLLTLLSWAACSDAPESGAAETSDTRGAAADSASTESTDVGEGEGPPDAVAADVAVEDAAEGPVTSGDAEDAMSSVSL